MTDTPDVPAPIAKLFGAADAYEKLTGGWPARISKNLVENLPIPITADSVVLDNACGSGAATTAILNATKPQGFVPTIHAVDLSPGMIEHVKSLTADSPEVKTALMDMQSLTFGDNTFTHIINAFGVFFCPDYEQGYREMYRVAAPGSVTVITSWKTIGWKPLLDYVVKSIKPEQEQYNFPAPPGFADAEWVKERMEAAGGKDVSVREILDFTFQKSVREMATAILPLTEKVREGWTEEEKGKWFDAFDEGAEATGAERTPEGGWKFPMLALAATGRK
ncbi:hypothetical protein ABW19_dt0209790 [Dactylella cylindrospora]|nr:hypothetical protein ABW19_dt0209790 [Dactylella cylindrospora]